MSRDGAEELTGGSGNFVCSFHFLQNFVWFLLWRLLLNLALQNPQTQRSEWPLVPSADSRGKERNFKVGFNSFSYPLGPAKMKIGTAITIC